MSHRGARPSAQPRTLRSIAEDKGSSPASREDGIDYDSKAGAPVGAPGVAGEYKDEAEAARPSAGSGKVHGNGPKPI